MIKEMHGDVVNKSNEWLTDIAKENIKNQNWETLALKTENITKEAKDIQKLVESQISLEKKVHDEFDIEKEPVFEMT